MDKSDVLKRVGLKIRELREKQGISQEEFAARAGLDRSYYGGVERGERNLSTINIIKIAFALDSEVGEMFPQIEDLKKYHK